MIPQPKKENKLKKTAEKKPFVCPVVFAKGSLYPGPCKHADSDAFAAARHLVDYNGPKELYKFHPFYHSPKPLPKAKKPIRKKWTGWAVMQTAPRRFKVRDADDRKMARNIRDQFVRQYPDAKFCVSKIGELKNLKLQGEV
jgi:hypothetical protein